jgi:predicted O-linked N-acetylglucosamine transferase (SPINDLY family)
MGVPVISRIGDTHVSRVGLSLLHAVGLESEFAAQDASGYVRIAEACAGDLRRLSQIRASLRGRMESSSLTDAEGFTRRVENAYRAAWSRWCGNQNGRQNQEGDQ